mgnify:CR=1 FL=1
MLGNMSLQMGRKYRTESSGVIGWLTRERERTTNCKLSKDQCPKSKPENAEMTKETNDDSAYDIMHCIHDLYHNHMYLSMIQMK